MAPVAAAVGAKPSRWTDFPNHELIGRSSQPGKELGMMEQFHLLQEIIVALRNIRAEMKLDPKKKVTAELYSSDAMTRAAIERSRDGILRLAFFRT